MARPRIGITCSSGTGVTQPIDKVGRCYVDGVIAAGGLPVVLPSIDPALHPALVDDAVAGIDGLLLTGGGDVDPARYGAAADPACGPPEAVRDAWELALVAATRAARVPILGICRGAQVVNVAFGGSLVQHLPDRAIEGHDDLDRAAVEVHDVEVVPGSLLHRIVAGDVVGANTLHHQAVAEPGSGLVVSGVAADGVIEAVEVPGAPVLGVQWHPELLLDRPAHLALFRWLVAAAEDAGGQREGADLGI